MMEREVVWCSQGPSCEGDHHGWDYPLSDPMGDALRVLMDPMPNPILEENRRKILAQYGVKVV